MCDFTKTPIVSCEPLVLPPFKLILGSQTFPYSLSLQSSFLYQHFQLRPNYPDGYHPDYGLSQHLVTAWADRYCLVHQGYLEPGVRKENKIEARSREGKGRQHWRK